MRAHDEAHGADDTATLAGARPDVAGNLTRRTAAGLKWSYLAAATNAVVQVSYVAAMSRLLDREAFGLMAMAQITVNFGLFFSRMGLNQTIVQRATLTKVDIRIAATSSTLLGGAVALVGVATAPWIGVLYDESGVVPLVRVLSASFLLLGLGITSMGLLRRQMRFREIALIELATVGAAAVVGVTAALLNAGVWSLVAATLTATGLAAVLQYMRVRHPLTPLLSWRHARSLYASGSRFSFLRLSEFLGKNLDTLAVGRYLTTAVTGVYSRVYTLVNMPLTQYLSMALAKVLFTSFAAIQADLPRLRRAVRGGLLIIALVLMPTGAGMVVAAPELVAVVLGDKFIDGVALIPLFVVAAVLYVLSHVAQLVCEAVGDLNRTIVVQVTSLTTLVAALAVAATVADASAFAGALVMSELVRHGAYALQLQRVIAFPASAIVAAYLPGATAAGVVAVTVALGRRGLVLLGWPALPMLCAEIMLGAITLVLCVRLLPYPWMRRELWRRLDAIRRRTSTTSRGNPRWLSWVFGARPPSIGRHEVV